MTSDPGWLSPRRTKLRPPRIAGDVVVRPRLFTRLDRAAATALIVAPAGYGKTTLVVSWLAQSSLPSAWVSLDDEDNDPFTFLAAVVTAVATRYPGFGARILARLDSLHGGAFAELSTLLLNELDAIDREFVLVLDDYHVIGAPALHQLLLKLITYPPRALRLVVTARHDPPLPWHARTRSGLCELRAADLSFTEDEAAQFLQAAGDRPLAGSEVRALLALSQGWITGLRLAALSTRRPGTGAVRPDLLGAGRRNIVDYFSAELLADLAPEVLTFLTRTAILDLLTGPLCDYVLDPDLDFDHDGGNGEKRIAGEGIESGGARPAGGAALLQALEAGGLFTTGLDDEGAWYRYHPLFRQVLLHRLKTVTGATEIAGLYARASAWHEEHGLLDEALGYALATGNMALALDLVHRHRQKLLDKLEFRRLDRWRQQFPPDVAAASSDLLLIGGWLNHLRFNVPDLNADLQRATALVAAMAPKAAGARELRGEIAALRSHQLLAAGEAGCAVTVAQQALADLPPSRFYVRSVAMVYLAWGYQMAGDVRRLEELFAAAEEPWLPWNLAALRTIQVRSYVELAAANLAPVMANAPHMLALAETGEFKTSIAWAHYFLGSACYLRNDLGRAAEHFAGVLDLVEFAHMRAYAHSVIGLALTQQALGQPQAAVATVTTAQEILADKGFYHARTLVDVFAAELAARQGRKEEAQRWITRASAYLLEDAIPLFYAPELAATRIQLATGDHDLDVAQVQLQQEKARALRTHNVHLQIQILALEAALHSRQDDPAQATVALEGALALAAGGQVVQVFADLAVELEPVCDRLTASRSLSPFAAQVCSVVRLARELQGGIAGPGAPGVYAVEFNAATVTETDTRTDGATQNTPGSAPDGEPDFEILLTYREIDVLKLLCARLTNKEIARELGIATETVRQHTVNLFRKLGVHNRRQAAVVARNKGYVGW